LPSPGHIYASAGTFTAKLTVTNAYGSDSFQTNASELPATARGWMQSHEIFATGSARFAEVLCSPPLHY